MNETKSTNNKTFMEKPLFLIAVDEDTPFLLPGRMMPLYTDKEKAEATVSRFIKTYNRECFRLISLPDNTAFFAKMQAYGFNTFLLDGAGSPLHFSDFYDSSQAVQVQDYAEKYREIVNAQPEKAILMDNTVKGTVRRLPKIHRDRLICTYVIGGLIFLAGVIFAIFATDSESWSVVPALSLCLTSFGFACFAKLNTKLKLKNPQAAKLAKLSLILYATGGILIVLKSMTF